MNGTGFRFGNTSGALLEKRKKGEKGELKKTGFVPLLKVTIRGDWKRPTQLGSRRGLEWWGARGGRSEPNEQSSTRRTKSGGRVSMPGTASIERGPGWDKRGGFGGEKDVRGREKRVHRFWTRSQIYDE